LFYLNATSTNLALVSTWIGKAFHYHVGQSEE